MTTKQSITQAIYDHLQKVREAVEAELTNSDIQGVMEAESENIFNAIYQLSNIEKINKLEDESLEDLKKVVNEVLIDKLSAKDELINYITRRDIYDWLEYFSGYYQALKEIKK